MPKLKRNRKIRTCEYCYYHKLKCDRNTPCSTCVRTNNKCVYQFKNSGFDASDSNEKNSPTVDQVDAQNNGSIDLKNLEPSENLNTTNEEDINANSNERDITYHKKPMKIIFNSNTNNTPLYYSRAFLPYLEPSLNRMFLFKLSGMGEGGHINNNQYSTIGTYDFQRFGFNLSISDLIDEYPPKSKFDKVIHLYWDNISPLIPILDHDITMSKYNKFWTDFKDENNPKFDIDSSVLFLAMLFAVTISLEVNEQDTKGIEMIQSEKNAIYDTFEKFKLIFGFKTNPNLAFIQSSIILFQTSCIYYIGIFTYTASLARQAEFMGLHRDPLLHDVYPSKNHIKDIEIRRLSWHYIRYLDTSSSIVSGMPPHLIMANASTKFPSKYDFNPKSGKYNGKLNPFKIFTISRFKCSLVMETISHYLNSDFSSDEEKLLRWEGISKTVVALYQDIYSLVCDIFGCEKNPKYSQTLLRWLVSNVAVNLHRTYLFHRACDRRPYSHHNRVILKPANATKIGLAKLSRANSSKDFFEKVLTIRMPYRDSVTEVSILLLYETKIRVSKLPEFDRFKWFTKNANPYQYIYFIIRDIYHFPDKRYTFEQLPSEIKKFIFDKEILTFKGDIRKHVLDTTFTHMEQLRTYWCFPIVDIMDFLLELRKFVYRHVGRNNKSKSISSESTEAKDEFESNFEFGKYSTIINMLSTFSGEQSPNSFPSTSPSSKEQQTYGSHDSTSQGEIFPSNLPHEPQPYKDSYFTPTEGSLHQKQQSYSAPASQVNPDSSKQQEHQQHQQHQQFYNQQIPLPAHLHPQYHIPTSHTPQRNLYAMPFVAPPSSYYQDAQLNAHVSQPSIPMHAPMTGLQNQQHMMPVPAMDASNNNNLLIPTQQIPTVNPVANSLSAGQQLHNPAYAPPNYMGPVNGNTNYYDSNGHPSINNVSGLRNVSAEGENFVTPHSDFHDSNMMNHPKTVLPPHINNLPNHNANTSQHQSPLVDKHNSTSHW